MGTSINIPYFKVLDVDKDITFNPRYMLIKVFYFKMNIDKLLKNSNILSDFSFLIGDAGTKGHFFYNQIGKIK